MQLGCPVVCPKKGRIGWRFVVSCSLESFCSQIARSLFWTLPSVCWSGCVVCCIPLGLSSNLVFPLSSPTNLIDKDKFFYFLHYDENVLAFLKNIMKP